MGFDLDSTQRQALGRLVLDAIDAYYSALSDRPVQPPENHRGVPTGFQPMPEQPSDPALTLAEAIRDLSDHGFHLPSANYFGLMNPTPTYISILGDALASTFNPQLASVARSEYASFIERETLSWLAARVGAESGAHFEGTFTSGGNEANFSALTLAAHQRFPELKRDGWQSVAARPVIYCSAEAHHSLEKAAILMGLGQDNVHRVPTDAAQRMDVHALRLRIHSDIAEGCTPLAVVATAGTTNSGAIDPLPELAGLCTEERVWFHVDGAYGAALVLSDAHKHMLHGLSLADSVSMDPHKWLCMPFPSGMLLTRHPHLQEQAFAVDTHYMPRMDHKDTADAPLDFYRISAQWSRRMNSLKLWLTLKVHGRAEFEELFTRQLQLAEYLRAGFRAQGLFEEVAHSPLPILNLRRIASAAEGPHSSEAELHTIHRAIAREFCADGTQWLSTTHVNGKSVIRLMVISYMSEQRHCDALLHRLAAAAHTVSTRANATLTPAHA